MSVCVALQQLSPTASIQDAQKWLLKNRFNSYSRLFSHFSGTHTHTHTITQTKMSCRGCTCHTLFFFLNCGAGSDLLKLTRDDLVQICGPADGIRLFNALKSRCVSASAQLTFAAITNMTFDIMSRVCWFRSVRPRLTVYVCQESPQESPLLERHSTNENGEHSITSSLHGKKKKHLLLVVGFF